MSAVNGIPPLNLNNFVDWVISRAKKSEDIAKVHDSLNTITMSRRVSIYLYNAMITCPSTQYRDYRDAHDFYTNHIMKTRGRRKNDKEE